MESSDYLSPTGSVIFAVLLSLILAYAVARALFGFLVNRARARRADRRYRPDAPLVAGPAVVRGTVAPEDDGAVQVQLDLQRHDVQTRSGTRTVLKEVARHGSARPFRLRLDSGAWLTVDPGDRWRLVDELEDWPRSLIRVAKLSAGETVVAVGQLVAAGEPTGAAAGGYRELPERALVLQPPEREPMLLASGSLGGRYQQRARTWIPWLIGALAMTAFMEGFALRPYYQLAAYGQPVIATATQLIYTPPQGKSSERCTVWALTPSHEDVVDEMDCPTFRTTKVGAPIPFILAPGHTETAQIGQRAKILVFFAFLLPVAVLIGLFALETLQWRNRRWYHPNRFMEG